MLKLIKIVLRANPYALAVTLTIAIAILSLMRINASYPMFSFAHFDKIKHGLAYFVLTCSWLFALESSNKLAKGSRWVVLAVFLYGMLMELFQYRYTDYRQADMFDIMANSFGIVFAALTYRKLVKLFKLSFV